MESSANKAATVNITYKNNSTYDRSYTITYNGSAVDLSGDVLRMDIKKNRDDQSYLYRLSTADSSITVSGTSNNIITFNKQMNLPNDTYYQDLFNVTQVDYIWEGLFKIARNITT